MAGGRDTWMEAVTDPGAGRGHENRLLSCTVLLPCEEGAFGSAPIGLPFSLLGVTFQR